jgi:L-tartrate/succinate antiporter
MYNQSITRKFLKSIIPIVVGLIIAIIPKPSELSFNAWIYFAIFSATLTGVILEPIPAAAVGLIGLTLVISLNLVYPTSADSIKWGLQTGFGNSIVWLIFIAFIFALGYEKTGLGRRIALLLVERLGYRTLGLGYAIALSDLALAPFMPSNTARSGGTIYPIISHIPPIYSSEPDKGTERKIGSYIMWTAFATTCVTSSMFLTGLAPNLLTLELAKKAGVIIDWTTWVIGFLPTGIILFLLVPIITYKLYPPEIKVSKEIPRWAHEQLLKMGRITWREIIFLGEVSLALILWIGGSSFIDSTVAALLVVSLMLITGIIDWDDILKYKSAWNVLVWFATLVALADGLNKVGFVQYVANLISSRISGVSSIIALLIIVSAFFWIHYIFASLTAHVTALYPIFLKIATSLGINPSLAAYSLAYTLGIMGIISPYATGPAPIYYGSRFIKSKEFWTLGLIFGMAFYIIYVVVGLPWLIMFIK